MKEANYDQNFLNTLNGTVDHDMHRRWAQHDTLSQNDGYGPITKSAFAAKAKAGNLRFVDEGQGNLITSLTHGGRFFTPVIDLDCSHVYIPSSTLGHGHLLLNVPMTYEKNELLFHTLHHVGVVEKGSLLQLSAHGFSSVRAPHIRK